MKYKTAKELVSDIRAYADFLEENAINLPRSYSLEIMQFSLYLTQTDYRKNEETGEYDSVLNEEKTKRGLKKFLDSIGSCEKKWDNGNIEIIKKFGTGRVSIKAFLSREVSCRKVPTGKTKVIPSTYIPERVEEEYDWVCDEVSLKNLVGDIKV